MELKGNEIRDFSALTRANSFKFRNVWLIIQAWLRVVMKYDLFFI